ncbi:hypothetical protein AVEN_18656-1 [Araneus ventricosus]|uniref:Uncharacterized protein n=1 Tax=Araneus ventricosus TaxID=182803 RepID=A0A4Y2RR09_ARAVE|nr:hypothetical protein AVEN_18656-1 [Araneus ventricosus]
MLFSSRSFLTCVFGILLFHTLKAQLLLWPILKDESIRNQLSVIRSTRFKGNLKKIIFNYKDLQKLSFFRIGRIPPTTTNCDSRVVPEGPLVLMDFEQCTTDLEICQFLTGATKATDFYQRAIAELNMVAKEMGNGFILEATRKTAEVKEKDCYAAKTGEYHRVLSCCEL